MPPKEPEKAKTGEQKGTAAAPAAATAKKRKNTSKKNAAPMTEEEAKLIGVTPGLSATPASTATPSPSPSQTGQTQIRGILSVPAIKQEEPSENATSQMYPPELRLSAAVSREFVQAAVPRKSVILERPEQAAEYLGIYGAPGQDYLEPGRIQWSNNMDFLLSLIGFAVDTANIWGFPFLCLRYGGGSFLIPYCVILVFCVIPVMYMELIIGQYVQQGTISVWKICPLFKGVGYSMVMVSYFVSFYYNVVLAWSMIYVYESIAFENVRWVTCGNIWNTANCTSVLNDQAPDVLDPLVDASKEFFRRRILTLEEGDENGTMLFDMNNLGTPNTELALCLLVVYGVLFTFLVFGVKVTGKVVWVTATVPYIVMGLLLFRGITLPGSSSGLYEFIVPNVTTLSEFEVWADAAFQVFFSAGAGFGVHLTYASYNPFQHALFRDCIVTMLVNSGTSILAGMVIFSYLGNVAYSTRQNISMIARRGPELVFEAFPTAMGRLPGANFFSCIFFFMLLLMGIDSSMGAMSSIVIAITDEFSTWFNFHPRLRPTFIFSCVSISYLFALFSVTRGGIYFYAMLDATAASVALIFAVWLQVIGISYVFGIKELCDVAEAMTGSRPGIFFNICWKFVTPIILFFLLAFGILGLIDTTPQFEGHEVPEWGYNLGLFIAFTPIITVPVVALHSIFSIPSKSLSLKFKLAITPDHEYDEVLHSGISRRTTLKHLMWMEFPIGKLFAGFKSKLIKVKVAPAPAVMDVPEPASSVESEAQS